MNGLDVGENSIISKILSLNFDSDDSVLNIPHNLDFLKIYFQSLSLKSTLLFKETVK